MRNDFKKEICCKKEGGVLYEPPEPLFPLPFKKRRRQIFRFIAFLLLLGMITFACITAMSLGRDGDESGVDCENGKGDGECEIGTQDSNEAFEGKETIPVIEEEQTDAENETLLENEDITLSGAEELTDNAESAPLQEIAEADLSGIELGESYIINYSSKNADVMGLLDRGFSSTEKHDGETPVVMVIHTHTSEKYLSEDGKGIGGVVAVGDAMVKRLKLLGVSSLHCTVIHDGGGQNAYMAARETIRTMLKIYPDIKYVIDLHRMSLDAEGKNVKTVSGAHDGSAQIRLTVSAESGEHWQESLSLVLALRRSLNSGGERICMPAVVSHSRYNSDLCNYYIMADIGSSGNTAGEALAASKRLAEAVAEVILE